MSVSTIHLAGRRIAALSLSASKLPAGTALTTSCFGVGTGRGGPEPASVDAMTGSVCMNTAGQVRWQSSKPKKGKGKDAAAAADTVSYEARKAAEKARRTDAYKGKMERLERIKTRRVDTPKGALKQTFTQWFKPKLDFHQMMERKARQAGLPWKMKVATVVERLPVVEPDQEDWEKEYWDLKTHLYAYGRQYPKELGIMSDDSGEDFVMTDEELFALLPEGFKPAPRETEADATGDVKTTDRQLKTRIYLAVQDATDGWSVPTADVNESETLLDAAKRAVSETVGTNLSIYCPSNCPMAVDMKVYDKEKQTEYFGEKIFFFRVQRDEGDVVEADVKAEDYAWLSREEMTERVKEEKGD
eukprot:CAMPEP_0198293708 /NCGR_PEP_ID=MMETSP1449-20131203/18513_1 /TAXON_ID=420275 /ORGANISM="Attheya septentrionalis, Strain CCMP2084" /LENGTH=358 /DNA_ID=CAMNT_0043993399 /DNA_START=45 /DNA_END=1118 /DNA_ORIENTATION=-